jgi:DNA-directed RNA polymerase alpha subunit
MSAALANQHAKRMRRILLSSVPSLAVPHFFTLSHKDKIFEKNY